MSNPTTIAGALLRDLHRSDVCLEGEDEDRIRDAIWLAWRTAQDTLRAADEEDEIAIEIDPALAWMEAHPEEVARYAGQRIAVHPEQGIVAAGPDYLGVVETVRFLGLTDEVLIAIAPDVGDELDRRPCGAERGTR